MFQMKPDVNYYRQDLAVKKLLGEQVEPGETVGVGVIFEGANWLDKRVSAVYVICDGTYFVIYGTGKLAHEVYSTLIKYVASWNVCMCTYNDVPEPDYWI